MEDHSPRGEPRKLRPLSAPWTPSLTKQQQRTKLSSVWASGLVHSSKPRTAAELCYNLSTRQPTRLVKRHGPPMSLPSNDTGAWSELRESPSPPSNSLHPPTPGVAVLKRIDAPKLRKEPPPPTSRTRRMSERDCPMPPYETDSPPLGLPTPVLNGFDKLTVALESVMSQLEDGPLDERWVEVGRWVERYFVERLPGKLLERLAPLVSSVDSDVQGLVRPNLSLTTTSCVVLRQLLIMLRNIWPSYTDLTHWCFTCIVEAIFLHDPLEREAGEPQLMADGDNENLREQLKLFSGKTYFLALRDVSKRLGQAMSSFEEQSKEREKMCAALDHVISIWQKLYSGLFFRAWKAARPNRLKLEELEKEVKELQSEKKVLEKRQRRVDELVEEVRVEKTKEIQVLRGELKDAEQRLAEMSKTVADLQHQLEEKDAFIEELKVDLEDAAQSRAKLRRDMERRYSNLAKTAVQIIEGMAYGEDDVQAVRENPLLTPFLTVYAKEDEAGGQQGSKDISPFTEINHNGDPDFLLRWINSLATAHPLFKKNDLCPFEYFCGSVNAPSVWACALGTLSPSHVSNDEIQQIHDHVLLERKSHMLIDILRRLEIPNVIESTELVREAPMQHAILASAIFARYMTPFAPIHTSLPPITPCKLYELPREWVEASGDSRVYTEEDPMPDTVKDYLNVTPAVLLGLHGKVSSTLSMCVQMGVAAVQACLEGIGRFTRHRETHGQGLTKAEQIDRPRFITLDFQQLQDIVDTPGQLDDIQAVLVRNYRHLRKIFKHYGSSDARSLDTDLNQDELWRLIVDCGIPQKGIFDRTNFRVIFSKSDTDGGSGKQSLNPAEFTHALVHIAHARFKHRIPDPVEQFTTLIERFVIPEASYVDTGPFKKAMTDPLVQKMLERRQNDMLKAFRHYASMEMTDKSSTMSFKEFTRMMMDCKVTDEVCTHHALQQIFMKLQDEDSSKSNTELLFHEFIDAICAVAVFKNPAPFIPFHIRIQRFWQNWVLPPLKKPLKLTDGVVPERAEVLTPTSPMSDITSPRETPEDCNV